MADVHHGIVVVHGQGTARTRGSFLGGLVRNVDRVLSDHDGAIRRATQRGEAGEWVTTLHVRPPASSGVSIERCYEFVEAFWDDRFPPPTRQVVLSWSLRSAWRQLVHTAKSIRDPANDTRGKPDVPPQERWSPWWLRLSYRLQVAVLTVVLAVALLLAPVLLIVVAILNTLDGARYMRIFGFWGWVSEVLSALDPFLSRTLGDSDVVVEDSYWGPSARAAVEEAVIAMLGRAEIEDITIVAHSAGAGVVFDALLEGGRIGEALGIADGSPPPDDCLPAISGVSRKKLTFVSLGSAVNRMHIASEAGEVPYVRRFVDERIDERVVTSTAAGAPAPTFFWLDLYARLDAVPAGRLRDEVRASSKVPDTQLKSRQVVNLDSPLEDHGAYFENRALVTTRIVRSITGGEYPWPANPSDPQVGWVDGAARRRIKRVASLQAVRMVAYALGLIHLAAFVVISDWREWLTDRVARLNDAVTWLFDDLAWLQDAWMSGESGLALTLEVVLALLVPLVLLLMAVRLIREYAIGDLG